MLTAISSRLDRSRETYSNAKAKLGGGGGLVGMWKDLLEVHVLCRAGPVGLT